jgi:hypothetical protein
MGSPEEKTAKGALRRIGSIKTEDEKPQKTTKEEDSMTRPIWIPEFAYYGIPRLSVLVGVVSSVLLGVTGFILGLGLTLYGMSCLILRRMS